MRCGLVTLSGIEAVPEFHGARASPLGSQRNQLASTHRIMPTLSTGAQVELEITEHRALPQLMPGPRLAKRLLDLTVALPTVALLFPLWLLLMLWIKLDSSGPVFFRQQRVGRGGRLFHIFKLRTMVVEAERRGAQLTVGADQRITRCGHWLRHYKLDELPQLLNVIKGEMSLVGPRPEVPRYVDCYSPAERAILELTPGITSTASLRFRNESALLAQQNEPEQFYLAEVLPAKIRADLAYAQRATWLSDLGLIVQTLWCLLR
jgi:lipopolysaccharide/colanic/teichoic acid biosynthesis glycosyltransferase